MKTVITILAFEGIFFVIMLAFGMFKSWAKDRKILNDWMKGSRNEDCV